MKKIPITQILKDDSILNSMMNILLVNSPSFKVSYVDLGTEEPPGIINLKPDIRHLSLSTHQISTIVNNSTINGIKEKYNIEIDDNIASSFKSEILFSVYKEFKNSAFKLAQQNYLNSFTRWDKFKSWLWNILGSKYIKTVKIKKIEDLIREITLRSNSIHKNTQLGPANFVICNSVTSTFLQEHSNFLYNSANSISLNPFLSKIGQINNIEIFVDNTLSNNDSAIYVGRKPNIDTPGIHYFIENAEFIEVQKVENEDTVRFTLRIRSLLEKLGKNPEYNYEMFYYKLKQ